MNLSRCREGHFFDRDRDSVCPYCSGKEKLPNFSIIAEEEEDIETSVPDIPPLSNIPPVLSTPPTPSIPLPKGNIYVPFVDNLEDVKREAVELPTSVYDVELFRSSGQIRRKGSFKPTEKCTKVILLDLPRALREDSIHLFAEEGLVNRKVSVFRYYENHETEIEKIRNELEKQQDEAQPLFDKLQMCEIKRKSLHRYMKTQAKSDCGYQEFWGNIQSAEEEWNKLEEQHLDLQKKVKAILERDFELRKKITQLEGDRREVYGLSLEFVAEPGKEYGFSLDYVVNQVGWSPRYDIRTYTGNSEIQIILQADIQQNSGEDWNHVNLKLTTEKDLPASDAASIEGQKVSLLDEGKHEQNYTTPHIALPSYDGLQTAFTEDIDLQPTMSPNQDLENVKCLPESAIAQEQRNAIQIQYTVDEAVELKNNTTCTLVLSSMERNVRKLFFAVPKKECSEYMGVYAEGFRNEKLLDCSARVYVDDTYSTQLQTKTFYENGIVVLGRAHGVTLQRRIKENKRRLKKLSGQKELLRSYEIHVENKMDNCAQILIIDQIPVSYHSSVEISNVNVGDGVIDDEGICRWDITLNPHEKVVLPIEYVITYPQKEELVWN